jgi:hypothetical protein
MNLNGRTEIDFTVSDAINRQGSRERKRNGSFNNEGINSQEGFKTSLDQNNRVYSVSCSRLNRFSYKRLPNLLCKSD